METSKSKNGYLTRRSKISNGPERRKADISAGELMYMSSNATNPKKAVDRETPINLISYR